MNAPRVPVEERLDSVLRDRYPKTSLAVLGYEATAEIRALAEALRMLRSLVREGGVPRYTVVPGGALNSVIEEVVDPLLARHPRRE
jgi:hypothetical protein